ncbi:MAG: arylesterase [Hyphomicrobiales bacterium]|nr:arylesterase [Hyphomicrobiales bacterium]MDE2113440.1 arylesterase [Hyphomicrobiales bacterium]
MVSLCNFAPSFNKDCPARIPGIGWAATILLLALALAAPARALARPIQIVCFGDSLTAGYQLPQADAFPAVLEKKLRQDGFDVTIVNAGVSGDTATDGAARLDWSVPDGTDIVLLELGANDMLRAIDPAVTDKALTAILTRLQTRKIATYLAGMLATPDYGADYKTKFDAIYPALAKKFHAPLYPFFMQGVMGMPKLQLADGLHPNSAGVQVIVDQFAPPLEQMLKAWQASPHPAL